ncbi:MAG: multicopper oxidase domain-containing protein [Candidatus Methylomirabilales bacterium]
MMIARPTWTPALRSLLLTGLVLTAFVFGGAPAEAGATRHYYLAAEESFWDFAPTGRDLVSGGPVPMPWRDHTRWVKVRYIEYTDDTFTRRVPQPSWLGILGPRIRAEVGDTIQVHFLNRTDEFQGIHPQGVRVKEAEAAFHAAGRALAAPGGSLTYTWTVDAESGPAAGDPSSIVRWYGAPVDAGLNAALLGPILITRAGMGRPDGGASDVDQEFILVFKVFDEARGYGKGQMHSINGYIFGNLPGLITRNGERVRWHILDLGAAAEVKTPPPFAVPAKIGMKGSETIRVSSGRMTVTDMLADDPGAWALRGQAPDDVNAGMAAIYTVIP